MTYQNNFNISPEINKFIIEKGLDCLPEMMRLMINTAMQAERQQYIGAGRYERTQERRGHSNGYKDKTVKTRVGSSIKSCGNERQENVSSSCIKAASNRQFLVNTHGQRGLEKRQRSKECIVFGRG